MANYRNSKYIERYEDVVFELETTLNANIANGSHQTKNNYRFVVDNSGESTPFDWYHARLNVDFKVNILAGGNITAAQRNGIVNSAHSLIKKMNIKMNGIDVYDCSEANQAINIKNLLEYSKGYSQSQGTNEFFYIDTNTHADHNEFTIFGVADPGGGADVNVLRNRNADYSKGFAARKARLGVNGVPVNTNTAQSIWLFREPSW